MAAPNFIATVLAENKGTDYVTSLNAANHKAIADEPLAIGGRDTGPSPGDYLCMSLASCRAITLRMYVQRKGWSIENIGVQVSLEKRETEGVVQHVFHAEVSVDENTPTEQKERLLHIAKSCPISKLLSKQNEVVTKVL